MVFESLWKEFAALDEVRAVALGGSRASGTSDEKSDYDLYLYCDRLPDEKTRQAILSRHCSYIELGNQFWETEDDCTLNNGVDIDILYRDPVDFVAGLASVVEQHNAYNGYTTCMWHNLMTCRILYDEDGLLEAMKHRFDVPYPEPLRQNIIERSRKLLSGYLPSYKGQILKASRRGDLVAVNHRTAAFFESYFDIIFALNRMTHTGEKRMLETAEKEAKLLPADFGKNINALLDDLYKDSTVVADHLSRIIGALDDVLRKEGFIQNSMQL